MEKITKAVEEINRIWLLLEFDPDNLALKDQLKKAVAVLAAAL